MVDIDTGGTLGTGSTWSGGELNPEGDGLLGLGSEGSSYNDQISMQGTVYSDSTVSPTGFFVYTTTAGAPVLYPASVEENTLLNNPLNDLITPDRLLNSFDDYLAAIADNSDPSANTRYDNIVVTDPEILEYAERNGVSPGYVQANVSMTESYVFNQQLNGLPKEEADQLQFAYMTGSSENLNPELKAVYDNIMQTVGQSIREDFGFSSNWQPTENPSLSYQATVAADYGTLVENGIDEAVADGTISQDDAATLRTAFYDSSVQLTPEMQTVLTGIKSQATVDLQAKYGFSSNWQPVPDTASYMLLCNGDFATTYQDLCTNYIGDDISDADKALLEAYFANPNDPSIPQRIKDMASELTQTRIQLLNYFDNPDDPSIPDSVKTIAKRLIGEATNSTIVKYNLSPDWTPTITSLVAPGLDGAAYQKALNGLKLTQDMLDIAFDKVNQLPDSPTKMIYLNFLRQIGQAILDLQEAIGEMQVAKTDQEKQAANAKLNSALDNYKIQKDAADAAKEKQDKMGSSGALGDFLNYFMDIVMLVAGLVMGPVFLAIAIFYVTDKEVAAANGTDSLVKQMFTIIADWAASTGSGGQFLGAFLNYALATVLSVVSCNPFIALNIMTEDSGFIEQFVLACGGSETDAMICSMVYAVVANIVVMVVMTVLTGGAAGAATVAGIALKIAEVARISVTAASRIIRIAAIALQITMAALQITVSGISLNNNILLAQLDLIQGNADARSEEIEAMIQMLQQLINKLLEMLNGDTDWFTSLSTFNGQKWGDASQTLTNLLG